MPGNNKQPLWQRILMGGAVAEAPSVMTAAGHKIEKDGTVTVDNQNDVGVKQLRSSLPIIGASAAISVAAPITLSAAWKILNHPITQTIGTIDGFRNLLSSNGVQKTYNHFKNGEWGRGSLSLAGDVLDASPLLGGTKAIYKGGKALYNGVSISDVSKNLWKYTDIGRWLSSENRAKHAYVTINPEGYDRPFKRGFDFIKSWVLDKPVDINKPNWKLSDDLLEYIPKWINSTPADRLKVAHMGREDAWRIYNGLTPRHGIYISNPNGTYSYDLDKIKSILKTPEEIIIPLHLFGKNKFDYFTGAHGNLWTISQDIPGQSYGNKINYIQHIEDMWDLHPFSRPMDNLGVKLRNKYENLRSKFYNGINKILPNKINYSQRSEVDYPLFKWIGNKMKNFEIGTITGGKPFKLEMDIPYHIKADSQTEYDMFTNIERGFMNDVIEPMKQQDIKFKINPFNYKSINFKPVFYLNPPFKSIEK